MEESRFLFLKINHFISGAYELSIITKDSLADALAVIQQAFFVDENVSIATRVAENSQAIEELTELCIRAANDGVSLVAIEKASGKAVAACFNKIQVLPGENEENYFEQFEAKCKNPSSRGLMRYMIEMEKQYDVFTEKQIKCGLEIMFIATLREHRGHHLGSEMWQFSMDIANRIKHGKMAVPLEGSPRPECVMALATSNATAKIGEKFGFHVLLEVPFDQFTFEGKPFSERIGPEAKSSKLIFKEVL